MKEAAHITAIEVAPQASTGHSHPLLFPRMNDGAEPRGIQRDPALVATIAAATEGYQVIPADSVSILACAKTPGDGGTTNV
jgi:hypothetical protein